MAGSRLSTLCRHVTAALADEAADADLLARFAASRDEAAFAGLVRRHGPMVWAVCRNLLPNAADADDAFQATFLALVRGVQSVRNPNALGAFLHGVAVRVAHKLRRTAARRNARERKAATGEAVRPVADSRWDEVLAAVHEEVAKLPDGERTAFVVCCLEGVRQPDAAARLGWKPGTLSGRLSKAKQRLLDRLTRRGLAPAAALGALGLGATTGQALVPAKLLDAVVPFADATAAIPAPLLQLSHGVLDMTITKVKLLAAAVLVTGGLATGFGASFFANAGAQAPPAPAAAPALPPPAPTAPAPPSAAAAPRPPAEQPAPRGGLVRPAAAPMPPGTTGVARGPVVRPWDYKFVDTSAMTVEQFKKTLIWEGEQGWELAAIEHRPLSGSDGPDHLAILKRPRALAFGSPLGSLGVTPPAANTTVPPVTPTIPSPATAANPAAAASPELPPPEPRIPAQTLPTTPLPRPPALTANTTPSPRPAAPTLHAIPLVTANSVQMAVVLKELVAINEFGTDVTAVIADEASNSLLVKATPNGKKLIEKQVQQLEKAAEAQQKKKKSAAPATPAS